MKHFVHRQRRNDTALRLQTCHEKNEQREIRGATREKNRAKGTRGVETRGGFASADFAL